MKGKRIYLSIEAINLIYEAFDMLAHDYEEEHPKANEINELLGRLGFSEMFSLPEEGGE